MIDNVIVALYFLAVMGIGLSAARGVNSIQDFATSKSGYGTAIIFATFGATYIGGAFTMGNAERTFLVGIASVLALCGYSLKDIWISRFVAPRLDRFAGALSAGDIMATQYGRMGQVVVGVVGILLSCGIVGAQISATGYVFQYFFNLDHTLGILLGCGLTILYTTFGGIRSVIYTDVLQFAVLAIGFPVACILSVAFIGGPETLLTSVPASHLSFPGPGFTWLSFTGVFLSFVLGGTLGPPYVQRLLAGHTSTQAARGLLLAALFAIPIFFLTGLLGLAASVINPDLNPNLALPFIIDEVMPPVVKGLLIAAILSVMMSSADSWLNSASVAFTNDIYKPLRQAPLSSRTELIIARTATFIIGLGAILFSLSFESVIDILLLAYQIWTPTVVVPLIAVIWGIQRGMRTFVASVLTGFLVSFFWTIALGDPFDMPGILTGTAASLLVFWLYRTPATAPTAAAQG